jgi:metal-sulfur cluster biosynthetic enzyme
MQEDLERALNEVEDLELGIGIVDLGLIYRAEWTKTGIEMAHEAKADRAR